MIINRTKRGGGCPNPYGGQLNPSRIDFAEWIRGPECREPGKIPGEQLIALTLLSHAASDYLFYGLGDNGYTPDKFWEACEFFRTRSTDVETWSHSPCVIEYREDGKGNKVRYRVKVPEETLRLQCFDSWYKVSGIPMELESFLEHLRASKRQKIYTYREQVKRYVEFKRRYNYRGDDDDQLTISLLDSPEYLEALIWPTTPEQVELLLVPHTPTSSGMRLVRRHCLRRARQRRRRRQAIGQMGFQLKEESTCN